MNIEVWRRSAAVRVATLHTSREGGEKGEKENEEEDNKQKCEGERIVRWRKMRMRISGVWETAETECMCAVEKDFEPCHRLSEAICSQHVLCISDECMLARCRWSVFRPWCM